MNLVRNDDIKESPKMKVIDAATVHPGWELWHRIYVHANLRLYQLFLTRLYQFS